MLFLSLNTLVGAVAGSIVTVACPKVFAFVTKQWGSAKADAAPVVAKAEAAVVAAVANTVISKL
jgi:hypothetical protein